MRDVRINPQGTSGWAEFGLSTTWTPTADWTLVAGIDNLLDRRYRVHGSGVDAAGRNLFVHLRRGW